MELSHVIAERRIDEEVALRAVVEGTASETGQEFYRALVRNLARALDTHGAWLTEYDEPRERLRALAFWFGDRWVEGFEYPIAGTACETAIRERRVVHVPDRVVELYPNHQVKFPRPGVVSYLGVPLLGPEPDERVLGHLAVVDIRPIPAEKRLLTLFRIFANRALAEVRRVRVEEELRERQEKLTGLIGSAMDGIVEFDGELCITLMNAAAEKVFGCGAGERQGRPADELLGAAAAAKLRALTAELERRTGGERCLWIPDGLVAEPPGRRAVPGGGDAVALRDPGAPVLHPHPPQRGRAHRGGAEDPRAHGGGRLPPRGARGGARLRRDPRA